MFKPPALVIKGRGDPEQLARDWEDYLENFEDFLKVTDSQARGSRHSMRSLCQVQAPTKVSRRAGGENIIHPCE